MDSEPKHVTIAHTVKNMTYNDCCSTLGATLAFEDIENWQSKNHRVTFEATMMKARRNLVMPTSAMWKVTSKVELLKSKRAPSKKILFDKLTELEAINYLKMFQSEPERINLFMHAYHGKIEKDHDKKMPLNSKFIVKDADDPFLLHSSNLRNNGPFYSTHIMESEQVLEYKNHVPEVEEAAEYYQQAENTSYDPIGTMKWEEIIKDLPQELIEQVEEGLEDVCQPVQAFALFKRESETHFVKTKDTKRKKKALKGTGCFKIFLLESDGMGIVQIAKTDKHQLAHQLVGNFDRGMFRHYLDKVEAHKKIKHTYNFHWEKATPYVQGMDEIAETFSLS